MESDRRSQDVRPLDTLDHKIATIHGLVGKASSTGNELLEKKNPTPHRPAKIII